MKFSFKEINWALVLVMVVAIGAIAYLSQTMFVEEDVLTGATSKRKLQMPEQSKSEE